MHLLVKFAQWLKGNKINSPKMQWNADTGQVHIQSKLYNGQCDRRGDPQACPDMIKSWQSLLSVDILWVFAQIFYPVANFKQCMLMFF